jgi:hypothetical protein
MINWAIRRRRQPVLFFAGLESTALGSIREGLGGGRVGRQFRVEKAAAQGGFTACGGAWRLHGVQRRKAAAGGHLLRWGEVMSLFLEGEVLSPVSPLTLMGWLAQPIRVRVYYYHSLRPHRRHHPS